MPSIVKIEDHYEEAKALLPRQFFESPLINAHLKAIADSVQNVEDMLYDKVFYDQLLPNASGLDLDKLSRLYSITRDLLEDDESLRTRVIGEILKRNSNGTPDGVREVMQTVSGLDNMRVYQHYVGCPVIIGTTLDDSYTFKGNEPELMREASPITTGSTVFGVSYSDNYDNTFIPAELEFETYNLTVNSQTVQTSDVLILANGMNGVNVYEAKSEEEPTLLYSSVTTGDAVDVLFDGHITYVAEGTSGVASYLVEKEAGGVLTPVDRVDQGGNATGIWRDDESNYLYVNEIQSVESYTTDVDGSMTHVDSLAAESSIARPLGETVAAFNGSSSNVNLPPFIAQNSDAYKIQMDFKFSDIGNLNILYHTQKASDSSQIRIYLDESGTNNFVYVLIKDGSAQSVGSVVVPNMTENTFYSLSVELQKNGLNTDYTLTLDNVEYTTVSIPKSLNNYDTAHIGSIGGITNLSFDGEIKNYKEYKNNNLIADLPLLTNADDLTGNTTPVATDVFTLTCPSITRDVAEFNGSNSYVSLPAFVENDASEYKIEFDTVLDFTGNHTFYIEQAGTSADFIQFKLNYNSGLLYARCEIGTGASNQHIYSGFNSGDLLKVSFMVTESQSNASNTDLYIDINGNTVGPLYISSRSSTAGKTDAKIGTNTNKIWNFKRYIGNVLRNDLPLLSDATDATGNSTPTATDVSFISQSLSGVDPSDSTQCALQGSTTPFNHIWGSSDKIFAATTKGIDCVETVNGVMTVKSSTEVSEALRDSNDISVDKIWSRKDKHFHNKFNGTNNYVKASSLALDFTEDFELSIWTDFTNQGVLFAQTNNDVDTDKFFEISNDSTEFKIVLGGTVHNLSCTDSGTGNWRFIHDQSAGEITVQKGEVVVDTIPVTIGTVTEPTALLNIMGRRKTSGVIEGLRNGFATDFKFYKGGNKDTGTLKRHYSLLQENMGVTPALEDVVKDLSGSSTTVDSHLATFYDASVDGIMEGTPLWKELEYIYAAVSTASGVVSYAVDEDGELYFKSLSDTGSATTSLTGNNEFLWSADGNKGVGTHTVSNTGMLNLVSDFLNPVHTNMGYTTVVYHYDKTLYTGGDSNAAEYFAANTYDEDGFILGGSNTTLSSITPFAVAKKTGAGKLIEEDYNLNTSNADRIVVRKNDNIITTTDNKNSLLAELDIVTSDLIVDTQGQSYPFTVNGEKYQVISSGIDNQTGVLVDTIQQSISDDFELPTDFYY